MLAVSLLSDGECGVQNSTDVDCFSVRLECIILLMFTVSLSSGVECRVRNLTNVGCFSVLRCGSMEYVILLMLTVSLSSDVGVWST